MSDTRRDRVRENVRRHRQAAKKKGDKHLALQINGDLAAWFRHGCREQGKSQREAVEEAIAAWLWTKRIDRPVTEEALARVRLWLREKLRADAFCCRGGDFLLEGFSDQAHAGLPTGANVICFGCGNHYSLALGNPTKDGLPGSVKHVPLPVRANVLTPREETSLLESADNPRDTAILWVAVCTGLSPVQLADLRGQDFSRGRLAVDDGGQPGKVQLPKDASRALRAYLKERDNPKDAGALSLFVSAQGHGLSSQRIGAVIGDHLHRIGRSDLTAGHLQRHSAWANSGLITL